MRTRAYRVGAHQGRLATLAIAPLTEENVAMVPVGLLQPVVVEENSVGTLSVSPLPMCLLILL